LADAEGVLVPIPTCAKLEFEKMQRIKKRKLDAE
jgi:hypothetical protein